MIKKIKSFLFENKSEKQTFLKNAFWLTGGTAVSRIVRAFMIIYAARILGTEGYGVFSYALSLAAFFTIFSDIGLSGLLTRELVQKPAEVGRYIATTLRIKFAFIVLGIAFTLLVAPWFIKIDAARSLLPIVALLLAFDSMRIFIFAITRSKNKMEIESGLSVLTDVFITVFGFVALFLLPDARWLAIAYTAGSGLGLFVAFFVIRRWTGDFFKEFDRSLVKPILSSAWPFAVMGLLGGFMINIDTIIIGWFRSAGELGLYGAVQRPIQVFYMIPGFINVSLFPLLSKFAHEKRNERTKAVLERAITGALAVALPLTIGGIIVGVPFIRLVFGAQYLESALTFQLLLLTLIPIFAGSIIGNAAFAYDRQKIFLASVGMGAAANVVLDLLLIPLYGIAGSAVATIIAQIISNGYVYAKFRQTVSVSVFPSLGKITLASFGMGIGVFGVMRAGWTIIPTIIFGVIVYTGLLFILKEPLLEVLGIRKNTRTDS